MNYVKILLIYLSLINLVACSDGNKSDPAPTPPVTDSSPIANGSITNEQIISVEYSKITGLGTLATLNTVTDNQITSVDYSKVIGLGNAATASYSTSNTVSTLVMRDSSGNFTAGTITANLSGNATTSSNFLGSLSGDVTGTQYSTLVSKIQNRTISSSSPAANQVLTWNNTSSQWEPKNSLITSVAGKVGAVVLSISDITGLGSLASLSSVGNSQISSVDASKITPGETNSVLMTNSSGVVGFVSSPNSRVVYISEKGDFAVPTTVNSLSVECWGGGAGGGSGGGGNGGGGGGAGSYFKAVLSVSEGSKFSVDVGSGGRGGSGGAGEDGGLTRFGSLVAHGGRKGNYGGDGGRASERSSIEDAKGQTIIRVLGVSGKASDRDVGGDGGSMLNNGGLGGDRSAGESGDSLGVGGGGGADGEAGGDGYRGGCIVSY